MPKGDACSGTILFSSVDAIRSRILFRLRASVINKQAGLQSARQDFLSHFIFLSILHLHGDATGKKPKSTMFSLVRASASLRGHYFATRKSPPIGNNRCNLSLMQ